VGGEGGCPWIPERKEADQVEDSMAKKPSKTSPSPAKTVTAERAARLYQLLSLVGDRPRTRDDLRRRLKLDVRGFYRDLELLREAGIDLPLINRRYVLQEELADVLSRLPFPDPRLTLGEAMQLARGRTRAHRKLKEQIHQIED
jgi:predicted DNA-binding transcriptional regulator YafY